MLFFFVSIVAGAILFAVGPLVAQAAGRALRRRAADVARHGVVLGRC
jgi:Na+-driven multidrug efflux pump